MKNYRKSLVVCAAVLAVAAAAMAVAPQKGRPLRADLPQPEDATPVREGEMTERQKAHAKIYKGYADLVGRRKIKDLPAAEDGIEVWASISCDQVMPPIELSTFLKRLTCGADAVVYGVVKGQASQLDESGSFLFTDYEVALSEVLKSDDPSLQQGEEITVVRGGGAVVLNKHLVRAIDPNHGRLKVGEYYAFYLKRAGTSGGYRPFINTIFEDTFRLDKDAFSQISRKQWPLGRSKTVDAAFFLNEARAAVASSCEQVRAFK